jgi:hypothetical protein
VVLTNHQLRCWGAGENGVLGNGSSNPTAYPVVVTRNAQNFNP